MKKKYKFYKNRITKNHPSVEVDSNGTIWINLEVTSSPTKKNRYIELKVNPNPSLCKEILAERSNKNPWSTVRKI